MDKWLNDIHDRLKGYEQEPPQGLWEDIHARLEQEGMGRKPRRKASVWPVWPRRIAVAAGIAAVMLLGYKYMPRPEETVLPTSVARSTMPAEPASSAPEEASTTQEAIFPKPLLAANTQGGHTASVMASPQADTVSADETLSIASTDEPAVTSLEESNPVSESREEGAAPQHVFTTHTQRSTARPMTNSHTAQATSTHTPHHRLAIAAYTAGATGTQMSATGIGRSPLMSLGPDDADWEDSPALGMAIYNQGKTIERTIHHRLPVRVGASFSYELSDRLALGSGLTYTHLRSDLREGTEGTYQKSVQSLHYMGIPVTLRYTFLRKRDFSLYAQGGALAELRVAGRRTTSYILDGRNSGEDTERIASHPLQMSVGLSAGAQYNLTRTLALYAEPGVSHYFKDNSSVPTIYEDRPTNFSLNVGIRLCLGR